MQIRQVLHCVVQAACLASIVLGSCVQAGDEGEYERQRHTLIKEIEQEVRETSLYLDKQALDARVMQVLAQVPRHEFVPPGQRSRAYGDYPLPIGLGQTISQPYIVAYMTEILQPRPGMKVLEIGTGSGYQAAVLAQIGCDVYSIEIFEAHATSAPSASTVRHRAKPRQRIV